MSNSFNVDQVLRRADLLVGAVLVAGARAPVLVTKEMVATMKEGSVIVDVAVDQGGSIETIHATTLLDPTYVVSGVVHYGVANMPALVPRTSTFALTNATLPYVLDAGRARGDGGGAPQPRARQGRERLAGAPRAPRRRQRPRRARDPAGGPAGLNPI